MRQRASGPSSRNLFALARVTALGLCLLLPASPPGASQESAPPASDATLKVATEVVNVLAIVKDKKGRLLSNLNREDFELTEDNVRQQIRYFSRETDTPLTLGVMIDTSGSQERVLPIEQQEAKEFIRQVMRPKDLAFVLHFDLEVELLQDFTSDLGRLARAIDETAVNVGGRGVMPGPLPTGSVGGTHLHDSVYLAADELMKNEVGRKVLILLSDGEDQGSKVNLNTALEAAQKADVIIYSVAVIDREFYWARAAYFGGHSVLRKLSEETGGRVIQVDRARDTPRAFQEIAEELHTQYLLGYTSSNTRRDGSFRKIRVRVRNDGAKIQARRGYYAPSQ